MSLLQRLRSETGIKLRKSLNADRLVTVVLLICPCMPSLHRYSWYWQNKKLMLTGQVAKVCFTSCLLCRSPLSSFQLIVFGMWCSSQCQKVTPCNDETEFRSKWSTVTLSYWLCPILKLTSIVKILCKWIFAYSLNLSNVKPTSFLLGWNCFCPGWKQEFMRVVRSLQLTMHWPKYTLIATTTRKDSCVRIPIMIAVLLASTVKRETLTWPVWLMSVDNAIWNLSMYVCQGSCLMC